SLVSGVDPPDTALLIGSAPASIADSPATSPTGDMSVEAWVKPATMGTAQSIVEKYGHTSTTGGANNSLDGYGLRMNGDGTVVATLFAPDGTTAAATSPLPLTLGRWAHLVAADDGM